MAACAVDQYYSTLPSEDVPKLGTVGETNRSKRLVRQLPQKDLSLSACKFVESEHTTSYQDFVTGRNQVALDIGMAKPAPPNSECVHCTKPIDGHQPVVTLRDWESPFGILRVSRYTKKYKLVLRCLAMRGSEPNSTDRDNEYARCTTCDDLLVDLAYCVYEDNIYCERHYAEKMKPRCAGCDEEFFKISR
ncbi:hypothetical protein NQ317_002519 [Molorchus minor]|uniref:PET domain-containing protein n=1 Tax=Molorchus minor TaxID=1323400 RepID=A0ABQ9IYN2_9CUCU|nr:hypothetical protein NQ317_002519 [Molorchus minor]